MIQGPREILEKWNIVQFLYFADEEMNPGERKGLALGHTLAELKIKCEFSEAYSNAAYFSLSSYPNYPWVIINQG